MSLKSAILLFPTKLTRVYCSNSGNSPFIYTYCIICDHCIVNVRVLWNYIQFTLSIAILLGCRVLTDVIKLCGVESTHRPQSSVVPPLAKLTSSLQNEIGAEAKGYQDKNEEDDGKEDFEAVIAHTFFSTASSPLEIIYLISARHLDHVLIRALVLDEAEREELLGDVLC